MKIIKILTPLSETEATPGAFALLLFLQTADQWWEENSINAIFFV